MWRNEAIDYFVKNPGLGGFLRHMSRYEGGDDNEGVVKEAFLYNATHGTMIDDDASVASIKKNDGRNTIVNRFTRE